MNPPSTASRRPSEAPSVLVVLVVRDAAGVAARNAWPPSPRRRIRVSPSSRWTTGPPTGRPSSSTQALGEDRRVITLAEDSGIAGALTAALDLPAANEADYLLVAARRRRARSGQRCSGSSRPPRSPASIASASSAPRSWTGTTRASCATSDAPPTGSATRTRRCSPARSTRVSSTASSRSCSSRRARCSCRATRGGGRGCSTSASPPSTRTSTSAGARASPGSAC